MESDHDHQLPTISDQKIIDGDDQGHASVVVTINPRSYECNFCKRGFSNAQALGGHMNIHRKDKAKLKQQQSSNQTHQPSSLDNIHHEMVPSFDEERSNIPNWPNWNVSHSQQGHVSSLRQLPLFEESPPTSSENQKLQDQVHEEIITQQALSIGQGSSLELDLELRLGPEPLDSSAATSTRKFF